MEFLNVRREDRTEEVTISFSPLQIWMMEKAADRLERDLGEFIRLGCALALEFDLKREAEFRQRMRGDTLPPPSDLL